MAWVYPRGWGANAPAAAAPVVATPDIVHVQTVLAVLKPGNYDFIVSATENGCRLAYEQRTSFRQGQVVVDGVVDPRLVPLGPPPLTPRPLRPGVWDPQVYYEGPFFSPDGRHVIYKVVNGTEVNRVIDGKIVATYNTNQATSGWIGSNDVYYSPDGGHQAYPIEENGKMRLVVDGVAGPPFTKIYYSPKMADEASHGFVTSSEKIAYFQPDEHRLPPASIVYVPAIAKFAYLVQDGPWERVVAGSNVGPLFEQVSDLVVDAGGKMLLYIAKIDEAREAVIFNGATMAEHREIKDLMISPDARRVAYAAGDFFKWHVYLDNKPYRELDDVREVLFSPDGSRLAYTGKINETWQLYLNDEPVAPIRNILDVDDVFFSPNSRHLCIVESLGGMFHLVMDGVEGQYYQAIKAITFSPDGNHLAYMVWTGAKWQLVASGLYGQEYDEITDLKYSPDSKHLDYRARTGDTWQVMEDAQPVRTFHDVMEPALFNPDSTHLAFVRGPVIAHEQYNLGPHNQKAFQVTTDALVFRGLVQSLNVQPMNNEYDRQISGLHWQVVVDGVAGPDVEAVVAGPVWCKDGHLEYMAVTKSDTGHNLVRVTVDLPKVSSKTPPKS